MNFACHLFGHKNVEIELIHQADWWRYFSVVCCWTRHIDHAGFRFNVELVGLYFEFKIYDDRHWNDEENRWANSGDDWSIDLDGEI